MAEQYAADTRQWHARARQLIARGDLAAAEQACHDALDRYPRDAHSRFLLGNIAAERLQLRKAIEFLSAAIQLDRRRPEYFALLARCLAQLNAPRAALDAASRASALAPADALTLDTLGWVHTRCGDHAGALGFYREAVARQPGNAQFQFNLAAALKFTGDFAAAEQCYEAAIAIRPGFPQAHWALANLRRQTRDQNHVGRLEVLLARESAGADAELYLRHALAKELEDLGDYARAFDQWAAGNARKKAELGYQPGEDQALFDALLTHFTSASCVAGAAGDPSREPIFVVGMPRTGTTLVERILSSHSLVRAVGESQNFGLALKQAGGTRTARVLDPEVVRRGLEIPPAELGGAYLASTRPAGVEGGHFTDKTPLNFLLIGFICRALPNAKIVCVRRNPMDTCLSNFRQLFATDFSYYNYAYDLEDTARYYLLFDRLMAHWDEILPGRVLRVDYESLVSDQRAQSRRLIEHCELEWEAGCLDFQENAAPVATASAVQVREPIFHYATDRWRRYERQLEPARRILEAGGVDIP